MYCCPVQECFLDQVSDFVPCSFSVLVSLEVQITPSHGEISLGESKFFMCEGKFTKCLNFNLSNLHYANNHFLVFIYIFRCSENTVCPKVIWKDKMARLAFWYCGCTLHKYSHIKLVLRQHSNNKILLLSYLQPCILFRWVWSFCKPTNNKYVF